MSNTRPKALMLADALKSYGPTPWANSAHQAAAELIRLNALNAELLGALRMWLQLHEAPAGFTGKYGKALDAAIAAQEAKIDAAANASRAAIAKGEQA